MRDPLSRGVSGRLRPTDCDGEATEHMSSSGSPRRRHTVVLEGQIIGKPSDVDQARWILGRLSGLILYTAVALARSAGVDTLLSATKVTLTPLSQSAIDACMSDKAGIRRGHGIQGYAGAFVERIEGSYSGVVGLPLCEPRTLLHKNGIELKHG